MSITLREKRYREVQNSLIVAEAQREDILAKLIRSEAKLKALRKQKIRLKRGLDQMKSLLDQRERIIAKTTSTQEPLNVSDSFSGTMTMENDGPFNLKVTLPEEPPDIPDFLQRKKDAEKRDAAARAEIAAEKEAKAKAKRENKGVVRPSKKLGPDAKKMPLTGKAAMEFLRTGKR